MVLVPAPWASAVLVIKYDGPGTSVVIHIDLPKLQAELGIPGWRRFACRGARRGARWRNWTSWTKRPACLPPPPRAQWNVSLQHR